MKIQAFTDTKSNWIILLGYVCLFMFLQFCMTQIFFFWVTRYGFLLLENVASQDPLSISIATLQQFNVPPEMYQVGYTKLFFRTGQVKKLLFPSLIRTSSIQVRHCYASSIGT